MSLIKNKESGNFYPVSIPETDWNCQYLWSTHRGCSFDCSYCSSKRLNVSFGGDPTEIRRLKGEWALFPEKTILHNANNTFLKRNGLPDGKIFINPYCDIFNLPEDEIHQIFGKIYDSSEYWFDRDAIGHKEKSEFGIILQTKDPARYFDYLDLIPEGSWLGTTIECCYSGQEYIDMNFSKAPSPDKRIEPMFEIRQNHGNSFKLFVTIEPIMEFNYKMLNWIDAIQPDIIFLGANTSKASLPEPTKDELQELIYALYDTIGVNKVYLKSNIRRLIPAFYDGWKLAEEQNNDKRE